jgi:hypothetical protein
MKTLMLILITVLACTINAIGQNYIGMSQSSIISSFGKPDETGDNYIVYTDQQEEGTNIYYFDKNKKCVTFVLVRTTDYLENYKKMLEDEFTQTASNTFVRKAKDITFLAELTQTEKEFQIRIQKLDVASGKDLSQDK